MNNKIYNAIFILFFLFNCKVSISQPKYGTGLLFDADAYDKIPTISKALKFNNNVTSVYSLKKYCPIPENQGQLGTCASWATGYAAMTIAFSIQNNIFDKNIITKNAKSAMYLYNQVGNRNTCSGSSIYDNLKVCASKGVCDLVDFNPKDCSLMPNEKHNSKASQFKIMEYFSIFKPKAPINEKLNNIKNTLSANKPIIVGLNNYSSIQQVKSDGLYKPSGMRVERHAVCLIGYDDFTRRFEFINSWGTAWGDNGFFKMDYDDFFRDCDEAYTFVLLKNKSNIISLRGSFQLLNYEKINPVTGWAEFNPIDVKSDKRGYYLLNKEVRKDDLFRLRAKDLTIDTYIYVLSLKPDNKVEILFPTNYSKMIDNEIIDMPLIVSERATIELPQDLNNAYSADQRGNDLMCILFSKIKIDNLIELSKSLSKNTSIENWLQNSFGDFLISSEYIDFNLNEMHFSTKPFAKGQIVPIILKVKVN